MGGAKLAVVCRGGWGAAGSGVQVWVVCSCLWSVDGVWLAVECMWSVAGSRAWVGCSWQWCVRVGRVQLAVERRVG